VSEKIKFQDAMTDHTIKSVRLPAWAGSDDVLELPVIVDGCRTPWCTLKSAGQEHKFLFLKLIKDTSDYEVVERYPTKGESA